MAELARITSFERVGLAFDVIDEGPLDGPPVVLLHGFPQRATSWTKVTPLLGEAGFRTYAPSQRGYSPGARPRSRREYKTTELVDDVVGLIDRIDAPVHLVGHDWGATIAWSVAARHPDRLASLTAVSVGHPEAFKRALRTTLDQAQRSWYMGLFQLPFVPERLLSGKWFAQKFLGGSGMTDQMLATYRVEIVDEGALTGGLNWYRAIPFSLSNEVPDVSVPTTLVWSDGDKALGRRMAELTEEHVGGAYEFIEFAGASHWIPEERPVDLAAAIVSRAHAAASPLVTVSAFRAAV
jgi:pimeloyl-ACP methyl ester carboxylesterase